MGARNDWMPNARDVHPVWFKLGIIVALGGVVWSLIDFSFASLFAVIAGLTWTGLAILGARLRGDV